MPWCVLVPTCIQCSDQYLGWALRCIISSSLSPGFDTFSSEGDHRLRLEDHPIELYIAARNALVMIAFFIVEKTSWRTLEFATL